MAGSRPGSSGCVGPGGGGGGALPHTGLGAGQLRSGPSHGSLQAAAALPGMSWQEDTGLKANMRGGSREKGRKRLALPAPTRSCVRPNACGTALPWGGRGRGPEARGLPTGGWTEPAVWREVGQ